MSNEHLVRAYDEELSRLDATVAEMGRLGVAQIETALCVMAGADRGLARQAQERDRTIDGLERDVDQFTLRLLALRQPVGDDLRSVVAALRISIDLERVADCAASVARRAAQLDRRVAPEAMRDLEQMGRLLQAMLSDAAAAYLDRDAVRAAGVWHRDGDIDRLYLEVLEGLRARMTAAPESVETCTHLLFISKNLERIGDHLTNVCEHIQFMAGERPLTRGTQEPAGAKVIPMPRSGNS